MKRYDKLSPTVLSALFLISSGVFALSGLANETLGDRTMTNCTVSSPNSALHGWTDLPIKTSCGDVYISRHLKNSFGANPYAVTEMRNALASGKPVTIRATGITGLLMAYEITPTE
jgi:hypothetical protein